MRAIGEFELVDHGLDHPDYFQGCGVAFTEFEEVATGAGDNPASAVDDALEQLAMNGWETEGMEKRICANCSKRSLPKRPLAKGDQYYYVSLRVKE